MCVAEAVVNSAANHCEPSNGKGEPVKLGAPVSTIKSAFT